MAKQIFYQISNQILTHGDFSEGLERGASLKTLSREYFCIVASVVTVSLEALTVPWYIERNQE